MKKIIIALLILTFLTSAVFAQTEKELAGTLPGDTWLYKLDVWWDNYQIKNIKEPYAKAQKRLEVMRERIAEMNMAGKNLDMLNRAKEKYEEQLAAFQDQNFPEAQQEQIKQTFMKHLEVLERVYDKVPEEARAGINNAIANAYKLAQKKGITEGIDIDSSTYIKKPSSVLTTTEPSYACSLNADCIPTGCKKSKCLPQKEAEKFSSRCEEGADANLGYSCIKYAQCRCIDGSCSWTKNIELDKCLWRYNQTGLIKTKEIKKAK